MCVIFWSTSDAQYDLVIASNRDEFLSRPTLPAAWHDFAPASAGEHSGDEGGRVLSARDATGGGTWLGVTRNGAFATLTNFTEQSAPLPPGLSAFESRGQLVRDWLTVQSSRSARRTVEEVKGEIEAYLSSVGAKGERFPGFNLLVGAVSSQGTVVGYVTNRTADGQLNPEGQTEIFLPTPTSQSTESRGMSNSVLSQPWTKVTAGSATFHSILSRNSRNRDELVEDLFDLLWTSSNPKPAARAELRNSVLISPLQLPAPVEDQPKDWYATRTSTVILIGRDGHARLVERDTFKIVDGTASLVNGGEGTGAMRGRESGQRRFDWQLD